MIYKMIKLKEVADIVTGGTPDKDEAKFWECGSIPFVTPVELGVDKVNYISDAKNHITSLGLTKVKLIPKYSVMVCCIGSLGKIGIAQRDLVTNQQINTVIFDKDIVDYKYGAYALTRIKALMESLAPSTTVKIINKSLFSNLEISLPPLETQKKIAAVLDKAQELIDKRKEQLAKLDEFVQSVFLEMFGDVENNVKEFQVSPLSEFITHMTSGGRGWAKYYSNDGDRFIRSLDVQMNRIVNEDVVYVIPPTGKESDRTRVEAGDVLLTITGSRIGRVAYVPANFGVAYVSQHVAIIRTQGLNPIYLSYFISMPNAGQNFISKQQYGQTKPGLNFKQIESFPILKAPRILQNQFAAIVEKTEQQKVLMQQSLTEMANNFNSIMQRAFKGELF